MRFKLPLLAVWVVFPLKKHAHDTSIHVDLQQPFSPLQLIGDLLECFTHTFKPPLQIQDQKGERWLLERADID